MSPCRILSLILLVAGLVTGCEKQTPTPSTPAVETPAPAPEPPERQAMPKGSMTSQHGMKLPEGHPPLPGTRTGMTDPHAGIAGPHQAAQGGSEAEGPQPTETVLDGITLQIPKGWVYQTPRVNPSMPGMTPKAIFRLSDGHALGESLYVRVTHFPKMKATDEVNLQRWYGMLIQPDGRHTKDVATVERFSVGGVRIVLADIPGTLKAIPARAETVAAKPNHRMLAAIIKHDSGPHFVKLQGPADSVARWKGSFVEYLRSARTN